MGGEWGQVGLPREGTPEEVDVVLKLAGRRRELIKRRRPFKSIQLRGKGQRNLPLITGTQSLGQSLTSQPMASLKFDLGQPSLQLL